jgi:hypothetical protein
MFLAGRRNIFSPVPVYFSTNVLFVFGLVNSRVSGAIDNKGWLLTQRKVYLVIQDLRILPSCSDGNAISVMFLSAETFFKAAAQLA